MPCAAAHSSNARQANDGIAYEVGDVAKMGRIGAYDMVSGSNALRAVIAPLGNNRKGARISTW